MNQSVAIVTGASRGISRATTIRLARDFSAVVSSHGARKRCGNRLKVRGGGAEPPALALDLREPASAGLVKQLSIAMRLWSAMHR
jgi:3-oxoacyl-[acyl-carrier protein] reductase